MNRKAFQAAFPHTIPVLAGYLALGAAFGLMMSDIGLNALWAGFMSVVIYAGSGQILAVSLIAAGAALTQVALLTLVLHFRHFFYGLSLLGQFRDTGWRKPYLIFGLTDETYALLTATQVPPDVPAPDFYFAITLLDQSYWILGSVLGCLAGALIPFSTEGVDFAMTALFVVLLVEQVKKRENRLPALVGLVCTLLALALAGPERFLIPALVGLTACLLALRPRMERKEATA